MRLLLNSGQPTPLRSRLGYRNNLQPSRDRKGVGCRGSRNPVCWFLLLLTALTLNAQGNPNAVFIFQIGTTLTTASASSVNMINGGSGCNVFWQVGSSATLGSTTSFAGNILALASITLITGANASGRLLARTGAVTLDSNLVGGCAGGGGAGGVAAIPTLSEWAMFVMTLLLAVAGFVVLRRRKS